MRLDEGMVAHGERCDSRGLKMSEINILIWQKSHFMFLNVCVEPMHWDQRRAL